jgi:hypothetical protein
MCRGPSAQSPVAKERKRRKEIVKTMENKNK